MATQPAVAAAALVFVALLLPLASTFPQLDGDVELPPDAEEEDVSSRFLNGGWPGNDLYPGRRHPGNRRPPFIPTGSRRTQFGTFPTSTGMPPRRQQQTQRPELNWPPRPVQEPDWAPRPPQESDWPPRPPQGSDWAPRPPLESDSPLRPPQEPDWARRPPKESDWPPRPPQESDWAPRPPQESDLPLRPPQESDWAPRPPQESDWPLRPPQGGRRNTTPRTPTQGGRRTTMRRTPAQGGRRTTTHRTATQGVRRTTSPRTTTTGGTTQPDCNCPVTNEFNPICGTDGVSYPNPGRLRCAKDCGKSVSVYHIGNCVTTSTTSPANSTVSTLPP